MQTLPKPPRLTKDGGGPLSSKGGSIAAAVFTAIVAGLLIVLFLNQYRDGVNKGGVPTPVLVAQKLIEQGTSGDTAGAQALFTTTKVPRDQLKAGAITDAAVLRGKVTVAELLPGQQLTAADFKPAGHGIVTKLAPDERALSVTLDSGHGLLGKVRTGDHVDVLGGFQVTSGLGGVQRPVLQTLMQNVLVLDAPKSAAGAAVGGGNNTAQVVLRVTNRTAPRIAFAADNGKVWIALRPQNASNLERSTLTTLSGLLVDSQSLKVATGRTP
jgi:Flp pilus assembly protein CpaB